MNMVELEKDHTDEVRHFVDTENGRIYVGEAALSYAIEIDPLILYSTRPLAEVLTDTSVEIVKQEPLDVSEWSQEDHANHLKWLDTTVQPLGKSVNTKIVVQRAYELGMGPSVKRIDRLGSRPFSRLKQLANVEASYKRGMYDSWSVGDYIDYITNLALQIPKNASLQNALNEYSRQNLGPSRKVVARRFGTLNNLLELAGLWGNNMHSDPDRYLEWGVDFMLANNGLIPGTDALNYFSPKRLSPSRRSIFNVFGSLSDYQEQVSQRYQQELEFREFDTQDRLKQLDVCLKNGELPDGLIDEESTTEQRVTLHARWLVARELLPRATDVMMRDTIHRSSPESFTSNICRLDSTLCPADVEEAALMNDVFDIIWPAKKRLDRLEYYPL